MKARHLFISCAAALLTTGAFAQNPTQVIIANGGVFGANNHVTIGSWNIQNGQYFVFDSIPASSVQHVLVDNLKAYVCADSMLVRYDVTGYVREAQALVPGVRQSAPYQGRLVVTKGYGTPLGAAYVDVRSMQDLSLVTPVTGISDDCEGVAVLGDTAYVANPGTFLSTTGNIAVVDLQGQAVHHAIGLDTNGHVVQDVYAGSQTIYAISTGGFGSTRGHLSKLDVTTGAVTHTVIPASVGVTGGIDQGHLYAEIGGRLARIDLATDSIFNLGSVMGPFAAMTLDSINDRIYFTRSDFATFGMIYKSDYAGNVLDSAAIGISPEAIAVDYAVVTEAIPVQGTVADLQVFPVPFSDNFSMNLLGLSGAIRVEIRDIRGTTVLQTTAMGDQVVSVDASALAAGAYLLIARHRDGIITQKLIKTP